MQKIKDSYIVAGIMLLVVAFCLPYLLPLDTIVVEESYLQFASYIDLSVRHLTRDHALPFWAFHFGGGYPIIRHPDNMSLSPLFYLLVLPLGSGNGLKLLLLFSYFTGICGFLLLTRRILKFNTIAATIASALFIFNAFAARNINTGNVKDQGWFYLPLILYTLYMSKEKKRYLFFSAALIALLVLNGFSLYLPSMLLFIALFLLIDPADAGGKAPAERFILLRNFLLVLMIAFFLSAIKSFPIIEFIRISDRAFDNYLWASNGAMGIRKLFTGLLCRGPFAEGNPRFEDGLGMSAVMYFGIVPCLLAFYSFVLSFKRTWKYVMLITVFTMLSMARNSPIDLFYLLWHLPLFRSMHNVAGYFFFPVILLFPILVGLFFMSEFFLNLGSRFRNIAFLVIFISIIDVFLANRMYYVYTGFLQDPVPLMQKNTDFFNVTKFEPGPGDPRFADDSNAWKGKYSEELFGMQYFLLRQNIGLINWYGNVPIIENVIPKYYVSEACGNYWQNLRRDPTAENGVLENAGYRGECFFENSASNRVTGIRWSANTIVVDVEQSSPDKLIINQNYNRQWLSDSGKVYDANDRLGIKLSDISKKKVTLRYHPVAFYAGCAVTLLTFILCSVYFFIANRKRKKHVR